MTSLSYRKTRPLSDWLGMGCQYKGYISNWEVLPNGNRRFFFQTVLIKPWIHLHGDHAQRRIDHLWVYLPESPIRISNKTNFKRLDQMIGVGTITQYRRKDGSFDYGIDHIAAAHLDKALHSLRMRKFKDYKEAEAICAEMIDAIDRGLVLIGFGEDPTERRRELVELRESYILQQPVEERYRELRRQDALKPRPSVDILTYPSRKQISAKGFAQSTL
jgi:hypothetical protein